VSSGLFCCLFVVVVVQVSVSSVHVRLEDDVSGDQVLVAGAAIEQLLVDNSAVAMAVSQNLYCSYSWVVIVYCKDLYPSPFQCKCYFLTW